MSTPTRRAIRTALPSLALAALSLIVPLPPTHAAPVVPERQTLVGHLPPALATARPLGPLAATQSLSLALTLPLRNQAALDDLLTRLYDPADPLHGQFLTPAEFTARFGPTEADYQAVAAYARQHGLTVTGTYPNRLVLDVAGPAAAVEEAFGTQLRQYQAADGRVFHAPESEPSVPPAIAGKLAGIVGLDNAALWHPYNRPVSPDLLPFFRPYQIGTGPNSGLAPSDIKNAYDLNGVTVSGTGQTLALFELAGYTPSDITSYENQFHLTNVALQNILVDGYSGAPGSGADEVTLDIELQIALAPGASKILVYEGPNTTQGVLDTYNKIATDNQAKEISTSWGEAEQYETSATRNSENTIFQTMAAHGQTIFAASGDSGAYDYRRNKPAVDDPASQPFMCGVGGTSLKTNGAGGTWASETTWNGGSVSAGASGGGISAYWPIPSWQVGVVSAASKGSTNNRNVPDVSLDADPYTGYAVYYNGGWTIYGGTSCAAPLWAAFTALVNQQRLAAGKSPLGLANPAIYSVATSANYSSDFHDIADGSTNLYYPAVKRYDDATGWGSFDGSFLLTDLVNH